MALAGISHHLGFHPKILAPIATVSLQELLAAAIRAARVDHQHFIAVRGKELCYEWSLLRSSRRDRACRAGSRLRAFWRSSCYWRQVRQPRVGCVMLRSSIRASYRFSRPAERRLQAVEAARYMLYSGMRILAYTVLALLGGCVYFSKHTVTGACPADMGSPVRNFCVAERDAIWQGERPTHADASWLLAHGVATVVNLEVFLDDRHAFERANAPPRDLVVEYYHVPDFEPVHLFNSSLLDDHVAHFLAIMKKAPRPVYLHCLDGIDRSNVLIAAYRVLVAGVSPEQAIHDIERFHSPWLRVDAKYIRGLNARRAAILTKTEKWQERLRPGAKIECSAGRCTYSTAGQLRARGAAP